MRSGDQRVNEPRRRFLTLSAIAATALTSSKVVAASPLLDRNRPTTIICDRVFDGRWLLDANTVIIANGIIQHVGRNLPSEGDVIEAPNGSLLPGLIDAHVHASGNPAVTLGRSLQFGVTTVLEMMGAWSSEKRRLATENPSLADFRTALYAVTPSGGHPNEFNRPTPQYPNGFPLPGVNTPEQARSFVAEQIGNGADYVKIMIEDGSMLGHPGLPMPNDAIIAASVSAAHGLGKMAVAHALTLGASQRALAAGIDGLAHVFVDRPATRSIIEQVAETQAFVVPTLVLAASMMGMAASDLANNPNVEPRLDPTTRNSLLSASTTASGSFGDVLETVGAMHRAGIDILAGTDAASAREGVVHGASLHEELSHLVSAGLSPLEALRAATLVPARRFGLDDRGRIAEGLRADLLLVNGDPVSRIADTLNIREVWKKGVRLSQ